MWSFPRDKNFTRASACPSLASNREGSCAKAADASGFRDVTLSFVDSSAASARPAHIVSKPRPQINMPSLLICIFQTIKVTV